MATDPVQGEATPAPPAEVPPGEIQSTPDERQMAMVAHFSGMVPYVGWIIPLGLWTGLWGDKGGEAPFVVDQSRESFNMQLNMLMLMVLCTITCAFYVGFILVPVAAILNAFMCYTAGVAAKEGKQWRYPYNIRYFN